MTSKKKKNIKIASATGMGIFSLVAVFTATMAWFALNKTVNSSGMHLRVKSGGQSYFSGLTIHRCFTNESSSTRFVFKTAAATSAEYKIDDYSQLNTTQPVLMLFPLGKVVDGARTGALAKDIRLSVSTHISAYLPSDPDSSPATPAYAYDSVSAWTSTSSSGDAHTTDNFPFSCASSFVVVTWKDEVPLDTETSSKYLVDYDAVSSNSDPRYSSSGIQSFVTPNTNNLLWNGNTISLFDGGDSEQVIKYIGVIINYYQEALSIIFSAGKPSSYVTFNIDYTLNIS